MKSRTVRHGLSSASRSPRPSCCRKTVALSVGRRNSTVSISGTSTPSLKRSTVNRMFTSRLRRASRLDRRRWRGGRGDCESRYPGIVELLGHELGVLDADAEAEGSHPPHRCDLVEQGLQNDSEAGVVAGIDVGERRRVVPGASLPPHRVEVGLVVEPEVLERSQQPSFQGFPQAQLDCGAPVEPVPNLEAVARSGVAVSPRSSLGRRWRSKLAYVFVSALAWWNSSTTTIAIRRRCRKPSTTTYCSARGVADGRADLA